MLLLLGMQLSISTTCMACGSVLADGSNQTACWLLQFPTATASMLGTMVTIGQHGTCQDICGTLTQTPWPGLGNSMASGLSKSTQCRLMHVTSLLFPTTTGLRLLQMVCDLLYWKLFTVKKPVHRFFFSEKPTDML